VPEGTVTVRILGSASGLNQVMRTAQADVSASMGGIQKSAKGAGDEVEGVGKKGGGAVGGLKSFAGGLAGMAAGFAGFSIIKGVLDDFNALNKSSASLGAAMRDAGEKQSPAFVAALDKAQHAGEAMGYSAADTTDALTKMRLAGLDTTRSIAAMPTIMDLAAAKHLSLADAAGAVIKGMQGSGRALKDLNIALPPALLTTAKLTSVTNAAAAAHAAAGVAFTKYADASSKYGESSKQAIAAHAAYEAALTKASAASKTLAADQADAADRTKNFGMVIDSVAPKVGGQAAAAAQTMGGRIKVMKTEILGAATGMLQGMMPAFNLGIGVISELSKHMNIVLPVIALLTVAFGIHKAIVMATAIQTSVLTAAHGLHSAAVGIGTGVQWAFNAAEAAGLAPILAVVVGIGLLVGVIILMVTHVNIVKEVFVTGFNIIKGVIGVVVGVIVGAFKLTPFGFLITHVTDIVNFFKGLPGTVGGFLSGLASAIASPFKMGFNLVIDAIDWVIDRINSVQIHFGGGPGGIGKFDWNGFNISKIAKMHTGGIVPGAAGTDVPIIAQAGERIIPVGKLRTGGSSGGTTNINITAQTNADPGQISRDVAWGMVLRARRLG